MAVPLDFAFANTLQHVHISLHNYSTLPALRFLRAKVKAELLPLQEANPMSFNLGKLQIVGLMPTHMGHWTPPISQLAWSGETLQQLFPFIFFLICTSCFVSDTVLRRLKTNQV